MLDSITTTSLSLASSAAKWTGVADFYDACHDVRNGKTEGVVGKLALGTGKLAATAAATYAVYTGYWEASRYYNYLTQPDAQTIAQLDQHFFEEVAKDNGASTISNYVKYQLENNYLAPPSVETLGKLHGWGLHLNTRDLYHATHDEVGNWAMEAHEKGLLWTKEDAAHYAFDARRASRQYSRDALLHGLGKLWGLYDIARGGRFNGPTFEDLRARKSFEQIIDSARKSNAWIDYFFLTK